MSLTPKQSNPSIDTAIRDILIELQSLNADSPEYAQMVDQLVKLQSVNPSTKKATLSPDAILAAGANLVGILAILNFEKLNVISTKAIGFILKVKL